MTCTATAMKRNMPIFGFAPVTTVKATLANPTNLCANSQEGRDGKHSLWVIAAGKPSLI